MSESGVQLTKDNLRRCLAIYQQGNPAFIKEAEGYIHSWHNNPDLPGLLWQLFEDANEVFFSEKILTLRHLM
jgi:hypothetical protein